MSFTYSMNINWPRIEPCAVPYLTGNSDKVLGHLVKPIELYFVHEDIMVDAV